MCDLQNPIYNDDNKSREHLESLRWPNGPICPHCGVEGNAVELKGKSTRPGVWKCRDCEKPFSVTVGTLFERSHIPLSKWLLATHLMSASKKGVSAHQIHRMLGITYKSAWFMCHRIRESMNRSNNEPPLGGEGKYVEVDETFIGNQKGKPRKRNAYHHKHKVMSLVERDGKARSFHMTNLYSGEVNPILKENITPEAILMTDESRLYKNIGKEFAQHETVNHLKKEYARGLASTNTVEGFFSIFKRGMKGVYQHCSEKHLQRYLNEFDFRYSNRETTDGERAKLALKGITGKRLMYQGPQNAKEMQAFTHFYF
jgi:transposase-like protein